MFTGCTETNELWRRTDLFVKSLFLSIQKWTRDYVRGLVDVVVGTPNTILKYHKKGNPAGNYMFKVINKNNRTRFEICSELTIKTQERRHWRRSNVFIVNFEHISHLVPAFQLLILSK